MKYETSKKVSDIKITYIGGGSRGWAWNLMSDLSQCEDMSGRVDLYDIDMDAAKANEIIGNRYNTHPDGKTTWNYRAVPTLEEALDGADFVFISILPGTFHEMNSDVHHPEKYGIYQPVGDTVGPGGIIRAMRTIPMFEVIGEAIKKCAPNAWVINYTNPMTLCVRTLYRVFPEIKAFGCCHEVFGTQNFLKTVLEDICGIKAEGRQDIKVNPIGVNHFTWLTSAKYHDIDLFPIYEEYCKKRATGEIPSSLEAEDNWMNSEGGRVFRNDNSVKMELFRQFGWIAAAGDRHLAEFCPGKWFLSSPERVDEMHFALTPVSFRFKQADEKLERSKELVNGAEITINESGEDGVYQMRAILGLKDLVTNVNIPNMGQIPNLPIGAVVETNAVFRSDRVDPVFAGEIPARIHPLIGRICDLQETVSEGCAERDLEKIFSAFVNDPLVTCTYAEARKMFKEMCENTKEYLKDYPLDDFIV